MSIIKGFATPDATSAHSKHFHAIQHGMLGRTGLRCAQAGFGCYRVADGVDVHRRALGLALQGGINLIDTSANYADGESEVLVGKVLTEMIGSGSLVRGEIIVVTKAGYLQGRNYALSRERKAQGRPFSDLVTYAEGLEHCIHPEFLEEQLTRSLERLHLATVDFFLLHNPEYYLSWAEGQGLDHEASRREYDRRILEAFRHLEQETARGRIRFYGISSNTFPESSDRKDFTCFQRVLELADQLGPRHHFAMVQFPMNLLESGAAWNANQPDGTTLLAAIRRTGLAAITNRPLNAMGPEGLLRLADVETPGLRTGEVIHQSIQALLASETALVDDFLPQLGIAKEVQSQISAQIRIAPALLQQYREFPSFDAWCRIRDTVLLPRINGVLIYLERRSFAVSLRSWIDAHRANLVEALEGVTSIYAPAAVQRAETLKYIVRQADVDWGIEGSLSDLAIRAVRSTNGISSVLVGMRKPSYVQNVLRELRRKVTVKARGRGWAKVKQEVAPFHRSGEETQKGDS